MLPNPVFVEAGFLYGPGRLGFSTTRRLEHGSKTRQTSKLVLYQGGEPPVYLGDDEAEISIDLADGTIYEEVSEPVDVSVQPAAVDVKLLGSSNIAGILPAAPGEPESVV